MANESRDFGKGCLVGTAIATVMWFLIIKFILI